MAYQGRGRGYGGGGRGRWRKLIYLLLHCQHQNDSCIKKGSDESHFNVSLIVRDKVTRQCPQTTTFLNKRESRSRIESRLFCLPAWYLTSGPNQLAQMSQHGCGLYFNCVQPSEHCCCVRGLRTTVSWTLGTFYKQAKPNNITNTSFSLTLHQHFLSAAFPLWCITVHVPNSLCHSRTAPKDCSHVPVREIKNVNILRKA